MLSHLTKLIRKFWSWLERSEDSRDKTDKTSDSDDPTYVRSRLDASVLEAHGGSTISQDEIERIEKENRRRDKMDDTK